jgi:hypothetical protein
MGKPKVSEGFQTGVSKANLPLKERYGQYILIYVDLQLPTSWPSTLFRSLMVFISMIAPILPLSLIQEKMKYL